MYPKVHHTLHYFTIIDQRCSCEHFTHKGRLIINYY